MQEEEKSKNFGDYFFAALVAFIVSTLVFSVFVGQGLWSNVVTFQKAGDDLKQCFPGVIKLYHYLKNGFLGGVDTDSFNGATEFFSRSNMPNMYLPYIITSVLAQIIPARGAYLILYYFQMFICIYFAIRLGKRFFYISNLVSIIFACSLATMAMYETWYASHYFVVTLWAPVTYLELLALRNLKKKNVVLFSLPYVLCFTSGYITTSVALAVSIFVFSFVYSILFVHKNNIKKTIIYSFVPFVMGSIFSFPYCLQLLIYMKDVVKNASSSLYDTLYYKMSIKDLRSIFSSGFMFNNAIEQIHLITLGCIWTIAIILIIKYKIMDRLDKRIKYLFAYAIALNTLIIAIALGIDTPIVAWFYSFVPVFGSMHLPLRYLMITLPFLYLFLTISINELPDLRDKKYMFWLAVASFSLAIVLELGNGKILPEVIYTDRFILELNLIAVLSYIVYRRGQNHKLIIALCGFAILLPGLNYFYAHNEIGINQSTIKERSIVYNNDKVKLLDNIVISMCGNDKDRYLYAAFDSVEAVPNFLPGNYGWYDASVLNMSNYMGYELQLCLPNDYLQKFSWFDHIDWRYLVDTKADFIIVDDQSIENNKEILDTIVDWEQSNYYLDNTHRVLKIKSFVPSYFVGEKYVEDNENALNNGYFYSHDMDQSRMISFATDDATYFNTTIDAPKDATVSFLLYPNRNYKYYINGEEVEPIISNMVVYMQVEKGINEIKVVYNNTLSKVCNYSFFICYLLCIISAVIWAFSIIRMKWCRKKEV